MTTAPGKFPRRELLRLGALGATGQALPWLLAAEARGNGDAARSAKHCIYIFNYGGPSHIDTFDPKPHAPAEIRGPFDVIQTALPGVVFTEHLPRLAAMADRFALVRTVSHGILDHRQGGYYALTGHRSTNMAPPTPEDHPSPGAVASWLGQEEAVMPPYVTLPNRIHDNQIPVSGVSASFLGPRHAPIEIDSDPNTANYRTDFLELRDSVGPQRLSARKDLLERVESSACSAAGRYDVFRDRAVSLLTDPRVRQSFDIRSEPSKIRDRYGRTTYGQSLLLARRLIEAGTRLVTVLGGGPYPMDVWDTHQKNFVRLRDELLPPADQGLSALLTDLDERGLLDETLVVWLGEFGRTPRIGQTTISSMNKADGRDHWPHCYTVLLAGGGIKRGLVHGASDRIAAYPARDAVRPEDVLATVYAALGIDPEMILSGPQGRPIRLVEGHPIAGLL